MCASQAAGKLLCVFSAAPLPYHVPAHFRTRALFLELQYSYHFHRRCPTLWPLSLFNGPPPHIALHPLLA